MHTHPAFRETTLRDNRLSLDRKLRRAYLHRGPEQASPATAEPITLRLARTQDDEALHRLARLEGLPAPAGPHVVAEVEGTIVAAMSLGTWARCSETRFGRLPT